MVAMPGMLLIGGGGGADVDGPGGWWPPAMLLIGGIAGADVDGMGWWPAGRPFEGVKPKAASTTVSPAAAQVAATVRRRTDWRERSVIENVLRGDHPRRQAVRRAAGAGV